MSEAMIGVVGVLAVAQVVLLLEVWNWRRQARDAWRNEVRRNERLLAKLAQYRNNAKGNPRREGIVGIRPVEEL